jgi:hypothetical protein
MPVVRKKNDLCALGEAGHCGKRGTGPVIIEVNQDIVHNEGHRAVVFDVLFQSAQPECQKKLIAAAVAHFMDHERPAVRSKRFDDRVSFFILIRPEPLEGALCHRFEIPAGGIQHRALVFLAIAFDCLCENDGGKLQPDIVLDIRLNFAGESFGRFGDANRKGLPADSFHLFFLQHYVFDQ